jgi:hypothetical protein
MNTKSTSQGSHGTSQMSMEPAGQGDPEPVPAPTSAQSSAPASANAQAAPGLREALWSKQFSWMVFGVLTMVMITSVIYRPAETNPNEEYDTICGFKNLTGLPCPGCGLTHSFCEIGKGHLAGALQWNWLGIPLFLLMLAIWAKALLVLTNQYRPAFALDQLAARVKILRLTAIAFAVYGIGRIVYILLFNPAARTSNPFSKLFSLLGG